MIDSLQKQQELLIKTIKELSIQEISYLKLLIELDIDLSELQLQELYNDKVNNHNFRGRDKLYKLINEKQGYKVDLAIKLNRLINNDYFLSEKKKIVKTK
jgi:hypothetical protein